MLLLTHPRVTVPAETMTGRGTVSLSCLSQSGLKEIFLKLCTNFLMISIRKSFKSWQTKGQGQFNLRSTLSYSQSLRNGIRVHLPRPKSPFPHVNKPPHIFGFSKTVIFLILYSLFFYLGQWYRVQKCLPFQVTLTLLLKPQS